MLESSDILSGKVSITGDLENMLCYIVKEVKEMACLYLKHCQFSL